MSVVRTIVFPALRLLVWAVIAVALVVLAFRGGTGEAGTGGPGAPTLDLGAPPAAVVPAHVVDGAVDLHSHAFGQGRPDGELDGSGHAGASRGTAGDGGSIMPTGEPANRGGHMAAPRSATLARCHADSCSSATPRPGTPPSTPTDR